ncbi:SDR family oxidoreductase [Nonomuraea sp. NPDC050643]|uniref:type I polyketide synthase n=1 Tax=Nonomuraea sp. NPDC050643 TaxID=3155660 RepID=UPI00340B6791
MGLNPREDDIAVIGMACRFPGAPDIRRFWENLMNGVNSIRVLTDEELSANGVSQKTINDPDYVKVCPMIDEMDGFDAAFFGYTARDAQLRDPQGRLFLEMCHTSLEDAGYDVRRYDGTVGVYGGAGEYDYGHQNVRRNRAAVKAVGGMSVATATEPDYLTTTVSYRLGLQGPSFTVQTACSTALVAIHLACQSLRVGECDMALAGAVDVRLPYGQGHWRVDGGIGSADGRIRAFDAAASGTVFGSGVGVVTLKRLGEAMADGDHVYAVVRGSAVNNDGAARAGYTAPGVEGQMKLVLEALAVAEVDPGSIGFVEAHGTGTLVGDPIEVTALTNAFQAAGAASEQFCALGSVKPNIGHLGAAAGVAGFIKVCLMIENGQIPPTLNFVTPNPAIDFERSPFFVNTSGKDWEGERRAGVSSFGIGGTNAHMVLEQPPPRTAPAASEQHDTAALRQLPAISATAGAAPRHLLPISAKTVTALENAAGQLAEHLRTAEPRLEDAAWTLQKGRRPLPHRRTVVAGSVAEAAAALDGLRSSRPGVKPVSHTEPGIAFLFPGQGAQYPGMGQGLYRSQKVFRWEVDRCAEVLTPLLGEDLRELLYGDHEAAGEVLSRTEFAQPALFTIEYAMAQLMRSWGLTPAAMLGHSIGEYAAACLAGVFTLEDALSLVAARGAFMQSMPPGVMMAVPLPEGLVSPMLMGGAEVAAVNSLDVTVIAGPPGAVAALENHLVPWGVRCQRLMTSHAFHTGMMEPIIAPFRERVASTSREEPRLPFLSNGTGTWITAEQATDPGYWAGHLRNTVRFAACLETLAHDPDLALVEVGPGRTLSALARKSGGKNRTTIVTTMRHPLVEGDDEVLALEALGTLWSAGVEVAWESVGHERPGRRVSLPTYPFERQRFWLDPDPVDSKAAAAADEDEDVLPIDRAVYRPEWVERPLTQVTSVVPPGSRWMLLTPGDGPVEALSALLEQAGAEVTTVVAGTEFGRPAAGGFTLRPGELADYEAMFEALGKDGLPTHVVHGWTATDPTEDCLAPQVVDEVGERGFYSLLFLTQVLAAQVPDHSVRILAVSTNMQEVSGEDRIEPGKALLLGPSILVSRELKGIACRSVDLAAPTRLPARELAVRLLQEALTETDDQQVAWRGLKRWAWSYSKVPIELSAETPAALKEGGTYLVTGGLGGIGLTTAEELMKTCRANLVLIGRTPVPDRAEWPAILASDNGGSAVRGRIERLLALESLGGAVMVSSCDVSDENALRAVVDEAIERFGRIDGVFHSAGVAGGGMLVVRTREAASQVLAPKVAGTLALHRTLGDRVDFMVLFSSITSVVGDFGQVDYCAANNFLDAFARQRSALGESVLSISWAAWRDVGMMVDHKGITPNVFRELRSGQWSEPAAHPLLGRRLHDLSDDIVFSTLLGPDSHWILTDHRIDGVPIVPGSALIEMIRAAALADADAGLEAEIDDILFLSAVAVPAERELRVQLRPARGGYDVTVFVDSADAAGPEWLECAKAHVRRVPVEAAPVHDLAAARAGCRDHTFVPEPGFVSKSIVEFGPHWYSVVSIDIGERAQFATIDLPDEFKDECRQYGLHPGLFDDAVSNARVIKGLRLGYKYLPFGYRRIRVRGALPPRFYVHVRDLDDGDGEFVLADVSIIAEDGTEIVDIQQYSLRRLDPEAVKADMRKDADSQLKTASRAEVRQGGNWMIKPEDGMTCLRALLRHWSAPHLVVCPEGLATNLRRVRSLTGERLEQKLGEAEPIFVGEQAERELDTPYVEPDTPVQKQVASYWAEMFGIRQIGMDDDFADLGGNSLMAVQLAWRIRQHFDVEVTVARLFQRPTVRTLADLVEQELTRTRIG